MRQRSSVWCLVALLLAAGCLSGAPDGDSGVTGVDDGADDEAGDAGETGRVQGLSCRSAGAAWGVDHTLAQEAAGPTWAVSADPVTGRATLTMLNLDCPRIVYDGVEATDQRFAVLGLSGAPAEPLPVDADSVFFNLDVITPRDGPTAAFWATVGFPVTPGRPGWTALAAPDGVARAISWTVATDDGVTSGELVLPGQVEDLGDRTLALVAAPPRADAPVPVLFGDDSNEGVVQLIPSVASSEGTTWWTRLDADPAPVAGWLVTNATFDLQLVGPGAASGS